MDEIESKVEHEIRIETEVVGMGERHRAICSCGGYRSSRESVKNRAEVAGWQHARRMGQENAKPETAAAVYGMRRD